MMVNKTEDVVTADLIIDIISRLGVKDLMRFTCVSKSWLSLISSDSHLSALQFKRAASSDKPLMVLQTVHCRQDNHGASYCDFYHYCIDICSLEIHNPFHYDNDVPRRDVEIVDSRDGLLVLRQFNTCSMALLNPLTGKYHLVPPNPAGNQNVEFSGFGYDYDRKCYKLVTIIKPSETDHVLDLMIYCVNDTWRKVESKYRFDDIGIAFESIECSLNRPGVFVDNILFWHFKYPEYLQGKIVCFDLAEEEFFKVKTPGFGYDMCEWVDMASFNGRLCLVCTWTEDDMGWIAVGEEKERTDIWVFHEKRWTELFSITDPRTRFSSSDDGDYLKIIPEPYSTCGNKVLFKVYEGRSIANIGDEALAWYHLETGKFEKVSETGNERYSKVNVMACTGSLVGNGVF